MPGVCMSLRYADQAVPASASMASWNSCTGIERGLALRAQHVLDHRGSQQLDLIGRGAPIGILEGHDLALFGDAELAADRSCRRGRNGAAGRGAPAAQRSASAVKEGDRDSVIATQPGQMTLRLRELPVRGQIPAVLVRVGIADHDLLYVSLHIEAPLHQRHLEQFRQDGGRSTQVRNGLEQRHDGQRAALDGRGIGKQSGLLGEQVHPENIGGAASHAEDERSERLAVDFLAQARDGAEGLESFRGVSRQIIAAAGFVSRRGELGLAATASTHRSRARGASAPFLARYRAARA